MSASPLTEAVVLQALESLVDPSSSKSIPLVKQGLLRVRIADVPEKHVRIQVETGANEDTQAQLVNEIQGKIRAIRADVSVNVSFSAKLGNREITSEDPLPGVRNLLMVMSGKGGVGKSTVASNLTMALARQGYRVGLLDADIYGPSVPTMFGISGRPVSLDGKKIEPMERFGVKLMSIGFLLEDPKQAVVWRGPMLHGALQQFLNDVNWGKLDCLVMDLPPGTGDVALTLSQRTRVTGAIVVTTPQEVALIDVYKSVSMCQKLNIPVLGVVENESYFLCDQCAKKHTLFGIGGGQKVAELSQAPLLAQLPIDPQVRVWGDQGTPVVQALPHSPIGNAFHDLGTTVMEAIRKANEERVGSFTISREGAPTRLPIIR